MCLRCPGWAEDIPFGSLESKRQRGAGPCHGADKDLGLLPRLLDNDLEPGSLPFLLAGNYLLMFYCLVYVHGFLHDCWDNDPDAVKARMGIGLVRTTVMTGAFDSS